MQMLRKYCFYGICLLATLFCRAQAFANRNGGVVAQAVLDGSQHQISVDSSRTVEDSAFFNPSYIGDIDTSYSVQNQVTLMINEATTLYLRSSFTETIRLRIIYTTGSGSIDSIDRNFTVNYDSINAYSSRSSFAFAGAHKVTVIVLSITSNVSVWDPSSVLVIENQLMAKPDFQFLCSNTVTNITVSSPADTADELPVSWTAVLGADQYDVEWTYIDTSALSKYKTGGVVNPALVFLNNATRVSVTGTSYNIPLVYDDTGTLFIRVRPVQLGTANSVKAAEWSSDASTPVMGQYAFQGHERPLNWQSNISFAEEGKRKVVVQYYDGSLRSRQTVTKDNTTNTLVVGETYYDYQGRPVIQVMPSPTLKTIIQYAAGFNVSINGAEYSQSNYDTLPNPATFCSIHADSMSNVSGGSQYYSTNNPNKNLGLNQFIPNAHDYPFTETEYTPDNTGRINRQGGVGPDHQLGTGHETKYYYGTPDQNELDALFGTEVGDHSHYFKNMVRDANGQYSVSYVDMHGRTIATALAGASPTGLATLSSNSSASLTETLADSNSVFFQDQSMVSQKSLLVPTAGTYQFNYILTPAILTEQNCSMANICYTCRYDLEISITDNCDNQLLGGKAFDTVLHNFSLGSISTSCTSSAMSLSFSLSLPEGQYMVVKKLTADRDAYTYYLDSIYLPGNTCTSTQQFITQQASIVAAQNSQCAPSCSLCRDSVGTWTHFWSNYMTESGLPVADTASYRQEALTAYQNAQSACNVLCGDSLSDDNDILNAMLQDVTPPFGQYADTINLSTDHYSIFYQEVTDTNFIPVYKLSTIKYLDENGNPDSVYNQQSGIMVEPNSLSMSQFVQNFRVSWANALLPYHPEYCKLQALQAQKASNLWDRTLESINDYHDAFTGGYMNPVGNSTSSPDEAYPVVTGNRDPLSLESTSLKNALEAKLQKYQSADGSNPSLSLWALSCEMVKCANNNDNACVAFYALPANDYDTTKMCQGDLDMAWRNFRELYLEAKHDILYNQLIINPTPCTPANSRIYTKEPTNAAIFSAKHQPEFSDIATSLKETSLISYQGVNSPSTAANAQVVLQDSLKSFYTQNCNALVSLWAQQLSTCTFFSTSALTDSILPRLDSLCRLACDSAHPYGASTLPPGVTYTPAGTSYHFASFQDIINSYDQVHGISDTLHCNAELITSPQPYGNQPVYSAKPVYSRPSDCECKLINDLYNEYTLAGAGDASFAAFLLRTQQITMSNTDLAQLRSMCSNTTNSATCTYNSNPIYLPAAMQCNAGASCVSCNVVDSLYNLYVQQYPSDTPSIATDVDTTQAQKNQLFQNYMNNRLGFNKQTWEYLQFMDTCKVHAADTTVTSSCVPKTIAEIFKSGGTDVMTDMHSTSDSGFIMVGSTTAGGLGGLDAYIVRSDHNGNSQWAKVYGGAHDDNFYHVKATSDNGFIAVGTTKSARDAQGDMLIVKMDANGNTLWTKSIGFNTTSGERGFDIIQTSDGGYAALGMYDYAPGTSDLLAVRLDSGGVVQWVHDFGTNTSDDATTLFEHADTLIILGYSWNGFGYYGDLYKLQENSGNIVDSIYYKDASTLSMSNYFSGIYPFNGGYLIYTYNALYTGSDSGRIGGLNLAFDGTVLSNTRFNWPSGSTYTASGSVIPTSDGGYIAAQTGSNTAHPFWQKMNSSNSLLWYRENILPGSQTIEQVVQNADSSISAVINQGTNGMLLNLSSTATSGCYDTTVNPGLINPLIDIITNVNTAVDVFLTASHTDTLMFEKNLTPSDSLINCPGSSSCYQIYNGPMLCGKSTPIMSPVAIDSVTSCTDSTFFSVTKGTVLSVNYSDSLTGDFEQRYLNTCLQAYKFETFTVTHMETEYHHTLYYYDQAGNLVKTVPPAGVNQDTDSTWLSGVRAARAAGSVDVPSHTLVTNYRYNTLNQVVSQKSPDASQSNFWYDRLGRLAVSQNARQNPNNQYSFSQYDSIGRITEVGQLVSSTAITDTISRNQSSLQSWLSSGASSADQITLTVYDTAYGPVQPEVAATNIRNRVGWTALFNTASDFSSNSAAAAMYYSYDILGNVDTLVQDYKKGIMASDSNRFKKMVYDYDLVSGKVNQVSYQHGYADAFYHTYVYDAENRITSVQTSTDSINWDNDAFYSYYAHGPLARTVLGEQQVQGINYAYTMHGWLKAINPGIYNGTGYTLQADGSTGSQVATNAYNFMLSYYNTDFAPVSGVGAPDSAVSITLSADYRPLFNGNISSMGLNVPALTHPLLYNYQYDQLNRIVQMDAWNRTGSTWSAISKLTDFQERVAYDPNGNIQKYKRNGNYTFASQPLGMDSLNYFYTTGTNKLDHITDSVPSGNYSTDIDGQSSGNYAYDSIGELISDVASGITTVTWTVYGKIASISKSGTTILYTYDPGGNRISKAVVSGGDTVTTWYVRDAQGNVLTVYTSGNAAINGGDLSQTELHLYGSSRLGMLKCKTDVLNIVNPTITNLPLLGSGDSLIFIRGNKLFELTNHLGNVLVTISDRKYGYSTNDSTVLYFNPQIVSANDYYPFGSQMPGRDTTFASSANYRYGFNGKENDNEAKGVGDQIDYGLRIYDPRIGRWTSIDRLTSKYPSVSGYVYANNNPLYYMDPDGNEVYPSGLKGTTYWSAYQALLSNPTAMDLIKKFQGNTDFNLTYKVGKFPPNTSVDAHTVTPLHLYSNSKNAVVKSNSLTEVNLDRESYSLYRTFNGTEYKYDRAHTDLSRFTTLLHELIHAKIASSNFHDVESNDNHNYFANHYFGTLVKGITEFAKDNNLSLNNQEIKEAAFIGLEGTDLFHNYIDGLSKSNKTTYADEENAFHVRSAKIEFKTVATRVADNKVIMDGSESDKYNSTKKKE